MSRQLYDAGEDCVSVVVSGCVRDGGCIDFAELAKLVQRTLLTESDSILGKCAVKRHSLGLVRRSILVLQFVLQQLYLIKDFDKSLSKVRELVFDSWRQFGVASLVNNSKTNELNEPFVKHFRRQAVR